jgi:IS5 family transposase
VMLRIHFFQGWHKYSDPAMEELLHDMPVYRWFIGLDARASRLLGEPTILGFRHFSRSLGWPRSSWP